MSTATAEPIVSQDYVSGTHNLRLVVEPIRKKPIGEGSDFYTTPGKVIVFREGRYSTTDQEEIDWLDSHPSHGVLFHKVGFGEGGRTEDDSAAVVAAVVKMAFSGDYQKIADILIAERASYRRPDVIAACETVLNEVNSTPAEQPTE